jgi:hypothetical protein
MIALSDMLFYLFNCTMLYSLWGNVVFLHICNTVLHFFLNLEESLYIVG